MQTFGLLLVQSSGQSRKRVVLSHYCSRTTLASPTGRHSAGASVYQLTHQKICSSPGCAPSCLPSKLLLVWSADMREALRHPSASPALCSVISSRSSWNSSTSSSSNCKWSNWDISSSNVSCSSCSHACVPCSHIRVAWDLSPCLQDPQQLSSAAPRASLTSVLQLTMAWKWWLPGPPSQSLCVLASGCAYDSKMSRWPLMLKVVTSSSRIAPPLLQPSPQFWTLSAASGSRHKMHFSWSCSI
mmetsp:Transcript_11889/g.25521  ORF Transcript_11889/g.25521 Transcript_11889/m.25521 type:complete len:243 (-) Transcript_11889:1171-1899(-)